MYANYYGRSKHSEFGIFNDEDVKELISSRYLKMLKWERLDIFLILYVDDILFIGNYVFFLIFLIFIKIRFLMKYLGKTRILSINVYADRLRH
jgi:hypothetical protein